jgi:hypothetical protein
VAENFFTYAGVPHHEIGLYNLVELPNEPSLLDKTATLEAQEERSLRLFFHWFPLDSTPGCVYPPELPADGAEAHSRYDSAHRAWRPTSRSRCVI